MPANIKNKGKVCKKSFVVCDQAFVYESQSTNSRIVIRNAIKRHVPLASRNDASNHPEKEEP